MRFSTLFLVHCNGFRGPVVKESSRQKMVQLDLLEKLTNRLQRILSSSRFDLILFWQFLTFSLFAFCSLFVFN